MSESQTSIEGWAIVELFGHNKIAGYLTTAIIGISGMLRIDVPEMPDAPGFTRFYGPGAIYSLTLVTEDIARAALRALRPPAVTVYIPRQLSEPAPLTLDLDNVQEDLGDPQRDYDDEQEDYTGRYGEPPF